MSPQAAAKIYYDVFSQNVHKLSNKARMKPAACYGHDFFFCIPVRAQKIIKSHNIFLRAFHFSYYGSGVQCRYAAEPEKF